MSELDLQVEYEISTWRALMWIHTMRLLRFVVGTERAVRWAAAGAYRLTRWRIPSGEFRTRWMSFAERR